MKTLCEKCIFADYFDADDPCKMGIISRIDKDKISITDNKFNIISDYSCKYGFDLKIYDSNIRELGSIDSLKKLIIERAKIRYYLVIKITNELNIKNLCEIINSLCILPQYVSLILNSSNNTKMVIDTIKNTIDSKIEWKLHNFLDTTELQDELSIIFDTNAQKNDTFYFWVNSDTHIDLWNKEIQNINDIIYIHQPKCHALFRSINKDGLFLSFNQYKEMRTHLDSNIFKAINSITDPQFIYYA